MKELNSRDFVRKAFFSFFIPSLCSCIGLAIGGLADCIFVGNTLGTVGLTAISIGQPVYMLFNTISYSLSIGGSICYAAALGEGKPDQGNQIFGNILRFALGLYLCICAASLFFLPQVLTFLGAGTPGTAVWASCEQYVRAQLILCPVMFCQGPLYYFINCDNAPKTAAAALVTSNLLDILFNYIFVVLLQMGVAGAVYSTGIGAATMICISLTHFVRKRGCLRFTWSKYDFKVIGKSFKMGFATSVQYTFQFITLLVCNRLLIEMGGENGVAVFGIVFNVSLLATSVYDAISMALQPMVSTYHGEQNNADIRYTLKLALRVAIALSVVVALLLLIFPKWVCLAFGLQTGVELALGVSAVRIFALSVLPAGANMVLTYYYQSLEQELVSYLIFTLRSFVLFLSFSLLFARFGLTRFWWVYPCTEVVTFLCLFLYNQHKKDWTHLGKESNNLFTAFLYSKTAELGLVALEVSQYMERQNASNQQSYYVTMIVEEICGVILTSAFAQTDGYIQITVVANEDSTITLHLRDNAMQFNPFEVDTDQINLTRGTGLDAIGVKMIKTKAREFFYRRYAGFNTLVVNV